jgi:uncharacterized membrane protein
MHRVLSPFLKLWHQIHVHGRLAVSVAIGAVGYLLLPMWYQPIGRALMAWDIGAGLYLVLAWIMVNRTSLEQMRWRARLQDDGAVVVLVLTVAGAVASLAAIVLELSGSKGLPPARPEFHVGLVAVTFLTSWLLVHTSFALHYAHAYYVSLGQHAAPALEFPHEEFPLYMDFVYFAMVIGMTSQTADVALATTRMRRLVMAHGMIAFAFNTTLLALTINIAASLLG